MEGFASAANAAQNLERFLDSPVGERVQEMFDGVITEQAAPTDRHQHISQELSGQLWAYLRGKACQLRTAPYAVRLNARNIFQPDISVICDRSKIKPWGCDGAPDLVMEIASPSTLRNDLRNKMNQYRVSGVREYWVVYPEAEVVTVYLLADGEYTVHSYDKYTPIVPVRILEGCVIDLVDVFPLTTP
jgi:Uma2 family endonuclease